MPCLDLPTPLRAFQFSVLVSVSVFLRVVEKLQKLKAISLHFAGFTCLPSTPPSPSPRLPLPLLWLAILFDLLAIPRVGFGFRFLVWHCVIYMPPHCPLKALKQRLRSAQLCSADNYVTSNFSSAARCTCCGSWSGVVWPAVGFDECRRRRRGDAQTARTTHTHCTHTVHTRLHTHCRTHTPKTYSYANSALVFSAHLSPLRPHPPHCPGSVAAFAANSAWSLRQISN